jgi:BolA family transcriptional regulator, general stress-responsive regulator
MEIIPLGDATVSMQERIHSRLAAALAPTRVDVVDESAQHAGHSGARAGGETHYRVDILSPAFAGKSRVQRHRLVYEALSAEIADGVHALALVTRAPGEA